MTTKRVLSFPSSDIKCCGCWDGKMLTLSALLLFIALTGPARSNDDGTFQEADIDEILAFHNELRRKFANGYFNVTAANMERLKWSAFLQLQAEERIACTSVEKDTTKDVHEEELHIFFENPLMVESNFYFGLEDRNFTKAIMEWFSEIDQFVPSLNSCAYYRRCSNLNHMLNAGHTQIGCAYRSPCSHQHDDAFVCLYTGGVMEIPFFKAGPPCTKCHGLSSFCDDGLCAPCMGEAEYCDCRKTCRKENVGEGNLDNSTCTCQCQYGLGPNCDEECKNPEMYENWDICADIAADLCISPDIETRDMFRHFCPEQCTCRKYPQEGTHQDKTDFQDETHHPTADTLFIEEGNEEYPELK